jgi:hypothetical protein
MLPVIFDKPAAGQSRVEYGALAGAAAGSVGALKGVSSSTAGVFGNLDRIMKAEHPAVETSTPVTTVYMPSSSPRAAASRPATQKTAKSSARGAFEPDAPPPPPPPDYEDPRQIQAGIGYQELVRRFGPPSLQVTDDESSTTLTYLTKTGPVQVQFSDGKVTSAPKPRS